MNLRILKDPFGEHELEWRVQASGFSDGRPWAKVVPYVDSRTIMDRFDEACGIENWQSRYEKGPDGGVICGIGVRVNGEWVWKWDGAETPDDEVEKERKSRVDPVKTSLTNAFKRVAVQWGVGRYLYSVPALFAVFAENGQYQSRIKDENCRWNPPKLSSLPGIAASERKQAETRSKAADHATGFQDRRTEIWEACQRMAGGDLAAAGKILQGYAGVNVISKLSPMMVDEIHERVMHDQAGFRN